MRLETLANWHGLLEEDDVPVERTRMVYAVNRATAEVLVKLASGPRLAELDLQYSRGWDESIDRRRGFFDVEWGPVESWEFAIIQGPQLFVANPFYKSVNSSMSSNKDWSPIDLEALAPDAMPVTAYKPAKPRAEYDSAYTHWGGDRVPARALYRVAWRRMAANTGERTLTPAIIPPGTAHVHLVWSAASLTMRETLPTVAATMSSLIADLLIRTSPKGDILGGTVDRLPNLSRTALSPELEHRYLRLTALTSAYSDLWSATYNDKWAVDDWASSASALRAVPLRSHSPNWSERTPLRVAAHRRQAQIEIDAIVALSLGITADELCTVYRTQFAVLYGYDRKSYVYDLRGRLVPNSVLTVWRQKGDKITQEERTATNASGNTYEYEMPFVTLDREADMRQAYSHFERILQERS